MEDCGKSEQDIKNYIKSGTDSLFNGEVTPDKSTETTETSIPKSGNDSIVSNEKFFKEYSQTLIVPSYQIILEYHKSEIKLVNRSLLFIFILSLIFTLLTFVLVGFFAYYDKNIGAIISGSFGGVVDIIMGTLAGIFNKTLISKKSYFISELGSLKFSKMLSLTQTITDTEKRDDVISDILRVYFKVKDSSKGSSSSRYR